MERLIGLIPAAGMAKRLAPLPCSKELFPLGLMKESTDRQGEYRPKPIGLYIIERMMLAGVDRAFLIINKEKWDIPRYFGDGSRFDIPIAYLIQETLRGMPFALDQAYHWVRDETILFGMPDTIFYPEDAFQTILENHKSTKADITLGLFPTTKPERFGMVAYTKELTMTYTVDKPTKTDLEYMWGMGCWGPRFTQFLHEKLSKTNYIQTEVVLGDLFQNALEAGLTIKVVPFMQGEYIDIGNLDELNTMIPHFMTKIDK